MRLLLDNKNNVRWNVTGNFISQTTSSTSPHHLLFERHLVSRLPAGLHRKLHDLLFRGGRRSLNASDDSHSFRDSVVSTPHLQTVSLQILQGTEHCPGDRGIGDQFHGFRLGCGGKRFCRGFGRRLIEERERVAHRGSLPEITCSEEAFE